MAEVEIRQIHKSFGPVEVIKGVDLAIDEGEFIVLLGPSGCGKSTLLRIIAGLEVQSGGEIRIGGEAIDHKPPAKREIAMVFQSYALYPHLDVAGNWSLGLRQAGEKSSVIEARIAEASRILELDELLKRRPAELSGGQRQRVAIGRAIVRQPKVFLFDEPLSNLDAALRAQVRFEIAHLHKRLGATMIYVTHDQIEAMTLASRIVVLNEGVIEQVGTPAELYTAPQNEFVASFIGTPKMNILAATLKDGGVDLAGAGTFQAGNAPSHQGAIKMGVRPDGMSIHREPHAGALPVTLTLSEYLGRQSYLHLALADGRNLVVETEANHAFATDDRLFVTFKSEHLHYFAANGQRIGA